MRLKGGCGKINNKGKDEGLTLSETIKKGEGMKVDTSLRRCSCAKAVKRALKREPPLFTLQGSKMNM